MKSIIVALFASSSLLVSAPLPAFATEVAAACEGTVPEAWQRPGGFCDQNDFNKSLSGPSDSVSCEPVNIAIRGDEDDLRMLVAIPLQGCCTVPTEYEFVPSQGRVIVAYTPCCNVGMRIDPEAAGGNDDRDRIILAGC
jgi:hypothetical protein